MIIPMALGQETAATRLLFSKMLNGRGKTGATRTRKRTPRAPARRKASAARRGPVRLVKGSAAAKRYMARIRKMRRR